MNFYTAYELRICADLQIPELLSWQDGVENDADLKIFKQDIQESLMQSMPQVGPFLYSESNKMLIHIPDIALFLVESGNKITYKMLANSNEDDLRVFLISSCLGAILLQRDLFVLHGNVIKVGAGCIACVGHSTAGKSSLAAAFMQHGHPVVSDDVCAINQNGEAIPGIPRIKLNEDISKKLNIDTAGLKSIRNNFEGKYSLALGDKFYAERLPLLAVYELSAGIRENVVIKKQTNRFERFAVLKRHLYRPRLVRVIQDQAFNLKNCSHIAEKVHVSRIQRPKHKFTLEELRDLIIEDSKHLII